MLTPALNDPLIEQSTHFPLRMLNLLAMTPPPTANQSNLRFCFEALSSTSPSTGTDQPHAPLLSGSTITTSLSDDRPAVRRWAHLFCRNKVQTVWGRHRCALGVGYVPELASPGTRSESDYRAQLAQPPPRHRETIADLDLLLLGCPAVFVALVAPCPHISI